MQLNELDKKSLITLKDEIADLERRLEEVSTISANAAVPLEVLLEQSSYKMVWDDGCMEAEYQAKAIAADGPLDGKRLTYSAVLESGKRYVECGGGIISMFALKIMDGKGLFQFIIRDGRESKIFFNFTAIPGEKYVLFELALILSDDVWFEVKEIEGHIRYVCAMSTFLNPIIEEVK